MNSNFIQTLENIEIDNILKKNSKINELKSKYNSILVRIKKGEEYLDNPLIPMDDKEKTVPHFIKLTREASKILNELSDIGVKFDSNITISGFERERWKC